MIRICGLISLIVTTLLLIGCTKQLTHRLDDNDLIQVKTAVVHRQLVTEMVELPGSVFPEPNRAAHITSLIPGVLVYVGPQVGDWVQKGEVVVRLQDSIQRAQVHQNQAALGLAKATWDKTEHGARPQEIEQARAAVEVAKANALNAKQNKERIQKLYEQEISAGRDYDLAISQERIAQAQVRAAEANLSMVLKGPRSEDRDAAKAQADQAAGLLEQSQATLNLTELRSPMAGIVDERTLDIGEQVGPSTPVLQVVDPSKVYVQASLPVGYNDKLAQGQQVEITVPGDANKLVGYISNIGMKLDTITNTVPVQIEVTNAQLRLKFGAVVKARIVVERHQALVVPKESIIGSADDPHRQVVNLITENKSKPIIVETGITDGDLVEIKKGLCDGDRVAVNVNYELPEGTKVTVK